jgi:hypothetical protein
MKNLILFTALAAATVVSARDEVPDIRKSIVEMPLKEALQRSMGRGPADLPVLEDAVPAGAVRWHPSFEHALAAAGTSRKPVLLFQLLGRLDEEFC